MKIQINILYVLLIIMFSYHNYAEANTNIITLMLEGNSITNSNISVNQNQEPTLPDVNRIVNMKTRQSISINISATNINSFIRIMAYSSNLDFTKFTREKTRAIITFETLDVGEGYVHFQVDDNDKIIQRHIYKINVANNNDDSKLKNEIPQVLPPPMPTDVVNSMPNIENFQSMEFNNAANTESVEEYDQEQIQLEMDIANSLFNDKNYQKSLEAFSSIAKNYPSSIEAINSKLKMGEIMLLEKNYNSAFNQYENVYTSAGSTTNHRAKALYNMAVVSRERGRVDEALMYFLQTYRTFPETSDALNSAYEYAHELNKKHKGSTFIKDLSLAVDSEIEYETKQESILLLAEIYERDKQYQKSFDTYASYLKTYGQYSKFSNKVASRMLFLKRNFLDIK